MSFIGTIQGLGPLGYLAYAAVYMGLEVLAVPAVPFTMAAGALFGPVRGTAVASLAGTVAACIGAHGVGPHLPRRGRTVPCMRVYSCCALPQTLRQSGVLRPRCPLPPALSWEL